MTTSNVINFIKAQNKTFDKVFLNVDYMHREIKSIHKEIDKVVLETNFTPRTKNMNSDEIINELNHFIDEDLPVWLRASSCMCKPANYIYIAKDNKTVIINDEVIMEETINENEENKNENKENINENENDLSKTEIETIKKSAIIVTRSSEEELNISYDYYFHLDDWENN